MKTFHEIDVIKRFIEELQQRSTERCIEGSESDSEMLDKAADTLKEAQKLIQDLYMNCRDGQRINQHNPYTWAECNVELFKRLKPYMPEQT